MRPIHAIALLTPALVSTTAFTLPARAQVVNISSLQTNLQTAVCSNNWDQSLRAIAPLIGSPGVTVDYRQELVQLRTQIEGWRAAQAEFVNLPDCEGVARIITPAAPIAPSRPLDWERALQSLEEQRTLPPGTIRITPSTSPSLDWQRAIDHLEEQRNLPPGTIRVY